MMKWQYKHISRRKPTEFDQGLAKLGSDGWELCSVIVYNNEVHAYFKRQTTEIGSSPEDDADVDKHL